MTIAGIYLAAGNSKRMGCHKLSLPLGKGYIGSHALETAVHSSLDIIYIIVKDSDRLTWIPSQLKKHNKCVFIKIPEVSNEQSKSIYYGIKHAQKDRIDATVMMLADQPLITANMLEAIITAYKNNPHHLFIASHIHKIIMPPILFTSTMYEQLLQLKGDRGARAILYGPLLKQGIFISPKNKEILMDIDTKADYEKVKHIYEKIYPPI